LDPRPNILYLHSHDTGRYVQPYGYPVPTPNIQWLADQGVLFRQGFCAVPTCSGSRAALLTGQYGHSSGMLGLAHRGFELNDYSQHIVHTLHDAGYWTGLVGEQHISKRPDVIGYDHVVKVPKNHVEAVAPIAIDLISNPRSTPFFLSVGFFETHREFFEPTSARDALYSRPPENLPDLPETRRDIAAFKASARSLDQGVGTVLDALNSSGIVENTLVILTTDHGLAFPGAKATLYDRGLGVLFIMRGPGGFTGGHVIDAMVSHLDIYPTVCDLAGAPRPPWLQGESLLPLVRGETDVVRDLLFAEATFHAAYEPQRAVRTTRWKYIRRFDGRGRPVLPNTDDSLSKDVLLRYGWGERKIDEEQLFDLAFDPNEAANLAYEPAHAEVLDEMRDHLRRWMEETGDPLLHGPVSAPPGVELNDPDGISPEERPITASIRA
jgi:N-sulfoglucosamine sulfohydrolase